MSQDEMPNLKISDAVLAKIAKRGISRRDVIHCFGSLYGEVLQDNREQHLTNPPTLWFLSYTNSCRLLKIVYIQRGKDVHLRSAYEPNDDERRIYSKYGVPS